eukprot:Opistho-2@24683
MPLSLYSSLHVALVVVLALYVFDGAHGDILFGQSCALSGPTKDLGTEMRAGLLAAFREVNLNGGIRGQNLSLVSLDDQYEPVFAENNTRTLLNNYGVFGIIGLVGTPTAAVSLPLALAASTPFIGAFTGTGALRDPHNSMIVNIRASYNDETAAMVQYLVNVKLINRISLFVQDDSFGTAGYNGAKRALTAMGMRIESEGKYPRNTLDVEAGLGDVLTKGRPQAIIMVGTYSPLAKFVKLAKADSRLDNAENVIFMTVSFVGSNSLRAALGNTTDNVLITEVVPLPFVTANNNLPVITNYVNALAASDPTSAPSHVSLEGYIVGRFVASVLERIPIRDSLSKVNFINTITQSSVFLIDGLSLGPYRDLDATCPYRICKCNQGMKEIWTVRMDSNTKEFLLVDEAKFNFYDTCFSDVTALKYPIVFGGSLPLEFGQPMTAPAYLRQWSTIRAALNASATSSAVVAATRAQLQGLADAFISVNKNNGVNGHRLHIKVLDDAGSPGALEKNVQTLMLDEKVYGFAFPYGPMATQKLTTVVDSVLANAANANRLATGSYVPTQMPIMGPLTADLAMRSDFALEQIYVLPSHKDEARAAIDYAVRSMGYTRIAILYFDTNLAALLSGSSTSSTSSSSYLTTSFFNGNKAYAAAVDALGHYGLKAERIASITSASGISDALDRLSFRSSRPQAVFVAAEGSVLASVVSALRLAHATTDSLVLVGSYARTSLLGSDFASVDSSRVILADGQMLSTNTSIKAVSGWDVYTSQAYANGKITGMFIASILARIVVGDPSQKNFLASAYSRASFSVSGLDLGPLNSATCDSGTTCTCNSALSQVFVYKVTRNAGVLSITQASTSGQGSNPFEYETCGVVNSAYVNPFGSECGAKRTITFTFAEDFKSAAVINAPGARYTVAIIILVLLLATMAAIYALTRPTLKSLAKRPTVTLIRRSMSNYAHLAAIIVEAFQLTSIVLAADLGWTDMKGFIHAMEYIGLEFAFSWYWYVIMVLSGLWILYAILIWTGVTEKIREWEYGHFLLLPVTHLLPLMGTLGYIPTLLILMQSFSCVYTDDGTTYLDAECGRECWTSESWSIAVIGSVVLLMFVPMAIATAFFWSELQSTLDIKFRPESQVLDYVTKLVFCVLRVFFRQFTTAFLSILLAINVVIAVYYLVKRPSLVVWVDYIKAAAVSVSAWTAIIGLASHGVDAKNAVWPQACVYSGWVAIIALTIAFIRYKHPQVRVRPTQAKGGKDRMRKIAHLFASLKRSTSKFLSTISNSHGLGSVSSTSNSTAAHASFLSEEEWSKLEVAIVRWREEHVFKPSECDVLAKFIWAKDDLLGLIYDRSGRNLADFVAALRKPSLQLLMEEHALTWGLRRQSHGSASKVSPSTETRHSGGANDDAHAHAVVTAAAEELFRHQGKASMGPREDCPPIVESRSNSQCHFQGLDKLNSGMRDADGTFTVDVVLEESAPTVVDNTPLFGQVPPSVAVPDTGASDIAHVSSKSSVKAPATLEDGSRTRVGAHAEEIQMKTLPTSDQQH